jgi:hypothetical protein
MVEYGPGGSSGVTEAAPVRPDRVEVLSQCNRLLLPLAGICDPSVDGQHREACAGALAMDASALTLTSIRRAPSAAPQFQLGLF